MVHYRFPETAHDDEQGSRPFAESLHAASSRRLFLRRSLAGVAIVAPLGLLAACGGSTTSTSNTSNTPTANPTSTTGASAVTLALPALGDNKAAFTEIMNDETAHVSFLQSALTKAGATPQAHLQGLAANQHQHVCRYLADR